MMNEIIVWIVETTNDNVDRQILGCFSKRKLAKKAVEKAVGHKLPWYAADDHDLGWLNCDRVPGYWHISIRSEVLNSEHWLNAEIKHRMEFAMRAEESGPIDGFISGLLAQPSDDT